jgi:hypothetical protein
MVGIKSQPGALAITDSDRTELGGVLVDPAASHTPPFGYLGGC